jgi:protein phosphatase
LVDAANERGGVDNITVVLIDVTGAPGTAARKPHRARGRTGRRRFPFRLIVWLVILLALVGGGYFGVRAWTNRSFYVGLDGERVAIYRGLPVSFAGVHLSHVEQPSTPPILAGDVQGYFLPRLRDGIRVPTLASARAQIAAIPLTVAAQQRLHPTPSPSPTTSAKPSVKATAT